MTSKEQEIFFFNVTCSETNIYFGYWEINQSVPVFQYRGVIRIVQLEKSTLGYFQMKDIILT